MSKHTPIPAAERDAIAFTPVPRKSPSHDGWTPERQRAFIEAIADTGSTRSACRMVNMSTTSAYRLRRMPGAESFRRAWHAASVLGMQIVKDEAFERAMHGQLEPVFTAGKLIGYRRVKSDTLLMFILRNYGADGQPRRTTINYVSSKAAAGAVATFSQRLGIAPPKSATPQQSASRGMLTLPYSRIRFLRSSRISRISAAS